MTRRLKGLFVQIPEAAFRPANSSGRILLLRAVLAFIAAVAARPAAAAGEPARKLTCAIVPDPSLDPSKAALAQLLQFRLAKEEGLTLLERAAVDAVVR